MAHLKKCQTLGWLIILRKILTISNPSGTKLFLFRKIGFKQSKRSQLRKEETLRPKMTLVVSLEIVGF